MTRTNNLFKRTIALLAVVIILSSIITIPAYASFTQPFYRKSRAFVASALTALNIVTQSAVMDTASMIEYIADPMEVQYTYIDAWEDRPEIQIYPDYVEIDGRHYTDIFISNEAAEKFRVDAFDFKTAYQIASNSNGTFKSGAGTVDGVPVFSKSTGTGSQSYYWSGNGTANLGNISLTATGPGTPLTYTYTGGQVTSGTACYPAPSYIYVYTTGNSPYIGTWTQPEAQGGRSSRISLPSNLYDQTPFDYDWVSGVIPADTTLPEDTGMMIRVPSTDNQGNPYFDDWLTDNPEFNQGTPVTIDVNLDPNIENKLDDLLDILIPIMPIINNNLGDVQFTVNHTEPEPAPYPEPAQDDLLPDIPWGALQDKLDEIRQTIQNLNPDFSQIIQNIQSIPQAISQAVQNLTQTIQNLGDTILQDIETGPIKVFDKALDLLKSIFLPILTTLKGFLGIWHYVVEWIGNISAPFTWILGIMSSTSGILLSPLYAVVAGVIVIAVYRRFGR